MIKEKLQLSMSFRKGRTFPFYDAYGVEHLYRKSINGFYNVDSEDEITSFIICFKEL